MVYGLLRDGDDRTFVAHGANIGRSSSFIQAVPGVAVLTFNELRMTYEEYKITYI